MTLPQHIDKKGRRGKGKQVKMKVLVILTAVIISSVVGKVPYQDCGKLFLCDFSRKLVYRDLQDL